MSKWKVFWRFKDLFVSIGRSPEAAGYRAQGKLSNGRKADAALREPISQEEIERVRTAFSGDSSAVATAEEIGRRLFECVFAKDVLGLRALVLNGLKRGQGLRIRFRAGAPEVAEWPVEWLHDSNEFLALRRRSPIVRYLGDTNPVKTVRIYGPLRILVVVSVPSSHGVLDVDGEWAAIQESFATLLAEKRVQVERLDNPTLADLAEVLKERDFHVLHFIGHGSRTAADAGVLFFRDAEGRSVGVTGNQLALAIGGRSSIRLVVLNACDGVVGGKLDRFSGAAANLIREEIPAVVAMQSRIPDDSAVLFSGTFYREVAKFTPIDLAVTEARRALNFKGSGKDLDWAIPVLFLGAVDGRLFRPPIPWVKIGSVLLVLAVSLGVWRWAPWKNHCPSPKSIDMEMAWIPAGKFLMGSGKKGEPPIEVSVPKPFCMGVTEVSQKQWETVMGANTAKDMEPRGDDLPIGGVTYEESLDFIRTLNTLEETDTFRLPTKEEWEYAARGPGESEGGNCLHGDDYGGLAPTGTFRNNDWGLYDMIGNVWEWVESGAPSYRHFAGSDIGPVRVEQRIRRGGSFESASKKCLATTQAPLDTDVNYKNTGLRIVREIP